MDNSSKNFNIDAHVKPGFDLIIELEDGVEYLLDKDAVASIKNNEATVILKKLFDNKRQIITTKREIKSLQNKAPIDHLKIS